MKRILLWLAIGALGAWTSAANNTTSGQASASAQSQAGAQTGAQAGAQANNSGAQMSGSGSAAMASSPSQATQSTANAGNSASSLSEGMKIDATLATSLDAKRSKPGDEVEARAEEDVKQDGKVVLKKGTRLVGHVTQAQSRAKGQTQSQLGILFDHAVMKNGQEMPFNASIQALASAESASAASTGAGDIMMTSGNAMGGGQGSARTSGGLAGGVASTAGATAGSATGTVMNTASSTPVNAGGSMNTIARSSGAVGGLNSAGRLASNSNGVFGMEGFAIDSAASSATQGSMIVSATKNVHLDSGTQLLLRTTAQAK